MSMQNNDFDVDCVEEIKNKILRSIENNISVIGLRHPSIGKGGDDYRWNYPDDYNWTDSFWTGQLWLAHLLTGEEKYKNCARMRTPHLNEILENPLWLNHDLGFEFSLSAVADYKLTGNKEARELALKAADALRSRFNWVGRYLVAWTAGSEDLEHAKKVQGKIIIDCLENLPLLLWAYQETNIASYKEVALAQAETSLKYLVRSDFSTFHTFDFDTTSNQPIGGKTWQGYADESCWSRGQAWGIHGFAMLTEITGDPRYSEVSAKLADYAFEKMGDDLVPAWDYLLPDHETSFKDTSAGSITSSGLFILANVLKKQGHEKADYYFQQGLNMLHALHKKHDLTEVQGAQGLLSQAAQDVPKAYRTDEMNFANAMLPYADYYYFEAVLRALGHKEFFWF